MSWPTCPCRGCTERRNPKPQRLLVERVEGRRYPWVATCTCGWKSIGYLTAAAAEAVGDDHLRREHP